MKKLVLSIAALAVSATAALAADLPYQKGPPVLPPPPPPPPLWTGFYVGLNAGGAWSNSNAINVASVGFVDPTANAINLFPLPASVAAGAATSGVLSSSQGGFIGGGQIGYNYQFYNNFVVGIEADIQGVAGSSSRANSVAAVDALSVVGFPGNFVQSTISVSKNLDYIGTVRGRLGWLATPTLLVYGTGGFAYGGATSNTSIFGVNAGVNLGLCCGNPAFASGGAFSDTLTGWTAGGGVEWMFMPNWSAKAEYLYYDLGNVSYSASGATPIAQAPGVIPAGTPLYTLATRVQTHFSGNIVRAGVNYHFNWGAPAPVVAKY
ncbi:outer membrane protein [Methylocystis parvus]|uniref:outer membrane protein n=1 Tax=Methylocystis parvus TaxID=134 RepID=UPI003C7488C3